MTQKPWYITKKKGMERKEEKKQKKKNKENKGG